MTGKAALFIQAQELMTAYTMLVDAQDFEGIGKIAHPEIMLDLVNDNTVTHTREAFVDLYRSFAASDTISSQHMTTNLKIAELDDGSISMKAPFVAITTHPDGARFTWGRYNDEIREHDGQWVFTAKRITITRTAILGEDMLVGEDAGSFSQFAEDGD